MLLQCYARVLSLNQYIEPITLRHKSLIYNVYKCYSKDGPVDYFSELLEDRRMIQEKERSQNPDGLKQKPQKSMRRLWHNLDAPNQNSFNIFNLKNWWTHQETQYRKQCQQNLHKLYSTLGYDLFTTNFILKEGGKVKIKGHDEWIDKKNARGKVPSSYDPKYFVVAIDIKDMPLEYEGVNNMVGLKYLQWLSLKGCFTIDDWLLDKLSAEVPALEYLDISECINVTERGLEALYRMPNLRKLIVTNFCKSAAFELTCMMLEDINPNLKCEILMPEDDPV